MSEHTSTYLAAACRETCQVLVSVIMNELEVANDGANQTEKDDRQARKERREWNTSCDCGSVGTDGSSNIGKWLEHGRDTHAEQEPGELPLVSEEALSSNLLSDRLFVRHC